MKPDQPTLEELNQIQREWMELQSTDPKPKQDRVFAQIKRYPRAYLNVSMDKTMANVIVDSMPQWATTRPVADAKAWLVEYGKRAPGVRLDVAWRGQIGDWVAI